MEYGTESARKQLFQLLEADEPAVITRETGQGETQRAVLTPFAALTEQQQTALPTWPAHGLTAARRTLGTLVGQAAAGAPQRLQRHSREVAALLPDGAVTATPATQPARIPRTLTAASDALDSLASTSGAALSYGLTTVDDVTGGLLPGRLALLAAAPGVGGSILVATAARHASVTAGLPVLYAAVGPTAADVTARIGAAHAGCAYQALRTGQLDPAPHVAQALAEVRSAPLYCDDGVDLDVEALAATVPDVPDLALLVVDRLQAEHDPAVPLSGPVLPAATRALAHLARRQNIPVLAAVDSDRDDVLEHLAADVLLRVELDGDRARLTARDADATAGTTWLRPDLARARFLDGTEPAPASAVKAQTEAADVSEQPREDHEGPNTPTPPAQCTEPSPGPDRAHRAPSTTGTDQAITDKIREAVTDALTAAAGDVDAATKKLIRGAIPDVTQLFDLSRAGGRYEHSSFPPVSDLLQKAGQKKGADAIWEGRLRWRNTNPGVGQVDGLDANAAYLAAFKTRLPIGQLQHDDSGVHDPKRAGIHRITPPAWEQPDLPSPLGDRKNTGEAWVSEPTLRLLQRCAGEDLCAAPVIHESWTSGSSEALLEKLRRTLAEVRRQAIEAGDEVTVDYIKAMYSKFISTMGESSYNRDIRRPDWMHILRSQAYSNLWLKARKAQKSGLVIVEVTGTDELHVMGDWRDNVFTEGRDLSEMKLKHTYQVGGDDQ